MSPRGDWKRDIRIASQLEWTWLLFAASLFLLLIGVGFYLTGAVPSLVFALIALLSAGGFLLVVRGFLRARNSYDALAAASPHDLDAYQARVWTRDPRISKEMSRVRYLNYSSIGLSIAYVGTEIATRQRGPWWLFTVGLFVFTFASRFLVSRARKAYEALPVIPAESSPLTREDDERASQS
jgi:hypothetical protein